MKKFIFIILAITLLVLTACKPVPEPAEVPKPTAEAQPEAEPAPSVPEEAKPDKEPPVDPQVILGIIEKTKAVFGE